MKPLTGTSCRQRRDNLDHKFHVERGAAAVEMALVMPLLILMVMGIIDFGRIFNGEIQLSQAAREGARIAALGSPAYNRDDVMTRAGAAMTNAAFQGALSFDCTSTTSCIKVDVVFISAAGVSLIGADRICLAADSTDNYGQVTITIPFKGFLWGPASLSQKAVMKCAG